MRLLRLPSRACSIALESFALTCETRFQGFNCISGDTLVSRAMAQCFYSGPEERRAPVVKRLKSTQLLQAAGPVALLVAMLVPGVSFGQSPFDTGANSLVDFALAIATPIAILVVIGVAIAAAVGRISWGWVIGCIVGIAAIFGAPQIVTWIRDMFAV